MSDERLYIVTYRGATNHTGSRMIVKRADGSGKAFKVSFDYALTTMVQRACSAVSRTHSNMSGIRCIAANEEKATYYVMGEYHA